MGLQPEVQFERVVARIKRAVEALFPVTEAGTQLEASNIRWEGISRSVYDDIAAQKKAKLSGGTVQGKLLADLRLVRDGKTIDTEPGYLIVSLPHLTRRGSFIVDGSEVQLINQLLLRPAPYVYPSTTDADIIGRINAAGGGYKINLVREGRNQGVFQFQAKQSHTPVYSLLRAMGVSDADMQTAWGSEIFNINKGAAKPTDLVKIFGKLRSSRVAVPQTQEELGKSITDFLHSKKQDSAVTKITLGAEYDNISKGLLLDTTKKMLAVVKGHATPDDQESVAFKRVRTMDGLIFDAFEQGLLSLRKQLPWRMKTATKINALFSGSRLTERVRGLLTQSEFGRHADQNNPLDMISTPRLTTVMGESGIQSTRAISDSMRLVHPSHMGVLDPTATPEGQKIGITGHFTEGADVDEQGWITLSLLDPKTGHTVRKRAVDVDTATVAFHDQYTYDKGTPTPKTTTVLARVRHDLKPVPAKQVDWIFADPKTFFGSTANIIPFMSSNDSNRVLMGGRHIEQAVQLVNPDKPMVQAEVRPGVGAHDQFAHQMAIKAPADGKVSRVSDTEIVLRVDKGTVTVPLHHHYPLNSATFLTDKAIVKVGDTVTKGQVLAENNFTKDGALALGKNLTVAYLPYHAMNIEDGIVISEGAAKKLTSRHKHEFTLDISPDNKVVLGITPLVSHFPQASAGIRRGSYDNDGVVKPGAKVEPGDLLIAAIKQITYHPEYDYERLHRALRNLWRDASIRWEEPVMGVVRDVVRAGGLIRVLVESEEPMVVGDKLSMAAGGKGIVAAVLPDNETYHDAQGNPIDVLYSPMGVPGRVNPGQMLEAAAGKLAHKTGKPYLVKAFDTEQSNLAKVRAALKAEGVSDVETITKPNGHSIDDVMVGRTHFLKLKHQVSKKIGGRAFGTSYTENDQPAKTDEDKPQSIGSMELYALLALGADAFIQDVMGVKSQRNSDFWQAVQTGAPLPPSAKPFVMDKFMTYLRGAGIDLQQDGNRLKVLPVTDKDTLARSHGEIKNPLVVEAATLAPEKGGLFDKELTGGLSEGKHWTHIGLAVPVVNPVFESALPRLLDLKPKDVSAVMDGKMAVSASGSLTEDLSKGKTGGEAIEFLLKRLDIDKLHDSLSAALKSGTLRRQALDDAHRRFQLVRALKAYGHKPADVYMQRVLGVVPPAFRPVYPMDKGSLTVTDANHAYREVLLVNDQIKRLRASGVGDDVLREYGLPQALQHAVGAVVGTVEPMTRKENFKGFIKYIKGDTNKNGFFQARVVKRRQELSGRSTAIPDPKLGIDEVGIPWDIAKDMYRPFIVKGLVKAGYKPLDATKMVDDGHKAARRVADQEVALRPLYMNRAPSLHKFNILAFKPTIHDQQYIATNPMIIRGYNLDYDGDQQIGSVLVAHPISTTIDGSTPVGGSVMAARFRTALPVLTDDYRVSVVDLEDFPRLGLLGTKDGANGPIEFYTVPAGVRVLAFDPAIGGPVWADVSQWSKHRDRLVEVVGLSSGEQIITDDDPRGVYGIDMQTLQEVRTTPREAVDRVLVPRIKSMRVAAGDMTHLDVPTEIRSAKSNATKYRVPATIPLTFNFGYLLGTMLGDGWVSDDRLVCLSGADADVLSAFEESVRELLPSAEFTVTKMLKDDRRHGDVERRVISSDELGRLLKWLLGHGARGKAMPSWYLAAGPEFRQGLFAGCMDTDGTLSVSNAKGKPQAMAAYTSVNLRLIREIKLLASTLGLKGSIGSFKYKKQNARERTETAWQLTFATPDVVAWGGAGMRCARKLEKIRGIGCSTTVGGAVKFDMVPMPADLAKTLRAGGLQKRDWTLYSAINQAVPKGALSRNMARRLIDIVGRERVLEHPLGERWLVHVDNDGVAWDRVVSVEATGVRETGFDLTVPGYETFTSLEGVVLSNTLGLHVPVSEQARIEALTKHLPSQNLWSPRADMLMPGPNSDTMLGIYLMTAPSMKPAVTLSRTEALHQLEQRKIRANQPVIVDGKTWTPGQLLLDDALPDGFKRGNKPTTAKELTAVLTDIAAKAPKSFQPVIDRIQTLGNQHITEIGFSVSLKDLESDTKARQTIMDEAATRAKTVGFDKAYSEASERLKKSVLSDTSNRFVTLTAGSGALGGKAGQVVRMIGAPVAVTDHRKRIIPHALGRSYAEGLGISDYWATLPGGRSGLVDKGISVGDTGAFSKHLSSAIVDLQITVDDCGTTMGETFPIESKELLDRVVAGSDSAVGKIYGGQVVSPDMLRTLEHNGTRTLTVRTPLHCRAARGLCAKCFGMLKDGHFPSIGYNIGALASQAVTEPLTQMTLRNFHCFHESMVVTVRTVDGARHVPFKTLWAEQSTPVEIIDEQEERGFDQPTEVLDRDVWTPAVRLIRHPQDPSAPMVMLRARDGRFVVCQDNHPLMLAENTGVCCGGVVKETRTGGGRCRHCGKSWAVYPRAKQFRETEPREVKALTHCAAPAFDALEGASTAPPVRDGWLAGMFLAEGCVCYVKEATHPEGIARSVSWAQLPGKVKDALKIRITVEYGEGVADRARDVQLYRTELAVAYAQWFGRYSRNKALPPEYRRYPDAWLVKCLAGVLDGDGTMNGSTVVLTTTSMELAQQVTWIVGHLGGRAVTCLAPVRRATRHQCFVVTIQASESLRPVFAATVRFADTVLRSDVRTPVDSTVIDYVKPFWTETAPTVYDLETASGTLTVNGMWAHNTAGALTASSASGFERVKQLLEMPHEIGNKATIAMHSGVIGGVEKAATGGWNVEIAGKSHFVPIELGLAAHVKPGSHIAAGEQLSVNGYVHPHELLEATGDMRVVQKKLLADLDTEFKNSGVTVKRRILETVLKPLTDRVVVTDPGGHPDLHPGDTRPLAYIENENRTLPKDQHIAYEPVLLSARTAPGHSDDFVGRMMAATPHRTLMEVVQQGKGLDFTNAHPVTRAVFKPYMPEAFTRGK